MVRIVERRAGLLFFEGLLDGRVDEVLDVLVDREINVFVVLVVGAFPGREADKPVVFRLDDPEAVDSDAIDNGREGDPSVVPLSDVLDVVQDILILLLVLVRFECHNFTYFLNNSIGI